MCRGRTETHHDGILRLQPAMQCNHSALHCIASTKNANCQVTAQPAIQHMPAHSESQTAAAATHSRRLAEYRVTPKEKA